jgi:hypothetical protein
MTVYAFIALSQSHLQLENDYAQFVFTYDVKRIFFDRRPRKVSNDFNKIRKIKIRCTSRIERRFLHKISSFLRASAIIFYDPFRYCRCPEEILDIVSTLERRSLFLSITSRVPSGSDGAKSCGKPPATQEESSGRTNIGKSQATKMSCKLRRTGDEDPLGFRSERTRTIAVAMLVRKV